MWRRLERATAAAAAGGTARPGSAVGARQDRFWQAVARKPAALAFFAKYYRQQVGGASLAALLSRSGAAVCCGIGMRRAQWAGSKEPQPEPAAL